MTVRGGEAGQVRATGLVDKKTGFESLPLQKYPVLDGQAVAGPITAS